MTENTLGLYVLAASNVSLGAIMISNPTDEDISLDVDFSGEVLECKVIDSFRNLSPIGDKLPNTIEKGTVLLVNVML